MLASARITGPFLTFFSTQWAYSQADTRVRVSPAQATLQPGKSVLIEIWVDNVEELFAVDPALNWHLPFGQALRGSPFEAKQVFRTLSIIIDPFSGSGSGRLSETKDLIPNP